MNQTEARKLWVEALTSGEYKQGKHYLLQHGAYCCLGVACELYRKHKGGPKWGPQKTGGGCEYDEHSGILPKRVRDWLGLRDSGGAYHGGASLVTMNDDGDSFETIAAVIESEPAGLFTRGSQ